jgi:hypothetical protein
MKLMQSVNLHVSPVSSMHVCVVCPQDAVRERAICAVCWCAENGHMHQKAERFEEFRCVYGDGDLHLEAQATSRGF